MNSSFRNAGQPEICPTLNQTLKSQNMTPPTQNPDTTFEKELYTIEWSDIENAEIDYENYLTDIENFFKEDFENDILEE